MKYEVGDLLFVKDCIYKPRRLLPRPRTNLPLRHRLLLYNTFGIITKVEKHSDLWEKDSTENDNCYCWYSQVNGKEYYFYEDEVDGEVIK